MDKTLKDGWQKKKNTFVRAWKSKVENGKQYSTQTKENLHFYLLGFDSSFTRNETGAPNEDIVQNHLT